MIHREFRWDNDDFLEAKYGHRCFYGPDAGHSDGDLDGAGGGTAGPSTGGGGYGPDDGHSDADLPGNTGGNTDGSHGPEGNPDGDVGDGGAAAACEARGGTWDGSKCSVPDDDDNNDPPPKDDGGGGHEGGGEEPENEADKNFAELLRKQWEDYKKRWGPVEEDMNALLTDDDFGEDVVRKARRAGLTMDNSSQAMRQMDRYGMEISGKQAQALGAGFQRDKKALGVGLANKTRAGMVDLKDALQKDMIGIGHGVGASATAGLGSAAQMETNRAAAIAQMKQQQHFFNQSQALQQQQYQMQYQYAQKSQRSGIFGLIGTAIGGGMFGPVGAMIGGGIGSMLG
jgi:hypothetical protein